MPRFSRSGAKNVQREARLAPIAPRMKMVAWDVDRIEPSVLQPIESREVARA